jgi:hypothetical protein
MRQEWFEMTDIKHRMLASAVWIPLRSINTIEDIGDYGYVGNRSQFYGVGSLAIPMDKKKQAEHLNWSEIGISNNHCGGFNGKYYVPSDFYEDYKEGFLGIHLVMDQRGNSVEPSEWHLHQDFVITLGLRREGDLWVRPDEGYTEVARLSRSNEGTPQLLEVRASHLKDYLCARGFCLRLTSYRRRSEVVEDMAHISWPHGEAAETTLTDRWEGCVREIHEGGTPFGAETFVMHASRTDVNPLDDVPILGLPNDDNIESQSWTMKDSRRKLFRIQGELWRNEWIEPASRSPIVRGDDELVTVHFISDSEGNQETKDTLAEGGRWLWFRTDVMNTLLRFRGSHLLWYTMDTGGIACSPDYNIHFGVNNLGLINVYAKDIVLLPEWQQKIWAGFNVGPEGGVSAELLMSQVDAVPADTQAPEELLSRGLEALNKISTSKFNFLLFKPHDQIPNLIKQTHRFRANDVSGLFSLAKDLARLTADSIDVAAIQKIFPPPINVKWGSLKSLENLIKLFREEAIAREIMGPLFGIYDLRLADAHLPSNEISDVLNRMKVDQTAPYVIQGSQLLVSCVNSIYLILDVLEKGNDVTLGGNPKI